MAHHILQNENKTLQSLKIKLDQLQQLNALLAKQLEPEAAKNIQVVKFEKNCLFVMVANGHWATQLRFRIPDLMAQLKQYPGLENLNGIISKTRPNPSHPPSRKNPRKVTALKRETAETILETAKSIKDTKLRKILERIAANT